MITSYDKFFAALIMAALFGLKTWFGIDFGLSEETVAQIAMFVTSVIVWAVPNKTA